MAFALNAYVFFGAYKAIQLKRSYYFETAVGLEAFPSSFFRIGDKCSIPV